MGRATPDDRCAPDHGDARRQCVVAARLCTGLSIAGEGPWPSDAAPLVIGLTVAADGPARLLPSPLAAMLEPGAVAGTARLQRTGDGWTLADIRPTGQTSPIGNLSWSDSRNLTGH